MRLRLVFCVAALLIVSMTSSEAAIGIVNHQGQRLSSQLLQLPFQDDQGKTVTLTRYLHTGRPILMALVYYGCPGVCTVLLNGMLEGLKQLNIQPGRAYEVVVVSIDPRETSSLAQAKKEHYLASYGRKDTANGWHFLTAPQSSIDQLSREVGFQYERDEATGTYIHPSALFILTPDGVLSSTLTGVQFSKKLLRVALLNAAGGRLGTFWDKVSSICYAYLPHRGWLDRPERWLAFLLISSISGVFGLRRIKMRLC